MVRYRNGDSPSGKAVGSGPTIRGFESLIPSQGIFLLNAAIAQLVERIHGKDEVTGSSPVGGSTQRFFRSPLKDSFRTYL